MSGLSPDEQDFPGHLLHQAALWDNESLLVDLLGGDCAIHVDSQDAWGRTPLHAAATTDNSSCLSILLKAGANSNIRSGAQDNFRTPLHTACEHGFLSNIRLLVESGGADVGAVDGSGLSPLDLALRGGHSSDVAEYLRSAGVAREESRLALHFALREAVCSSDVGAVKAFLAEAAVGGGDVAEIVNMTPNGTNTLLFKGCEAGATGVVEVLVFAGADGRIHPVTKYSPLYIAAYHGHKSIVALLLKKFPGLVTVPTVEKWLPLHASCINGHLHILDLLLTFEYPPNVLQTFRHHLGEVEYEMAFDINLKDVSGQNALYIACQMGNPRLVESLLRYRVPCRKIGEPRKEADVPPPVEEEIQQVKGPSPTKRRVSESIAGIISRLSVLTHQNLNSSSSSKKGEGWICPVDVNSYCEDIQTPLHVAVKGRAHSIATALLSAKADPNLPILSSPSTSSAILEACLARDLGMIDLLLKHGTRDSDSRALLAVSRDDIICGKLLALRGHLDSDHTLVPAGSSASPPLSPVNINWHKCGLERIVTSWVVSAALKVNPKLRLCPKNAATFGLQAVTRLDLSSNNLVRLRGGILLTGLPNLRSLNLSHNKISTLDDLELPGSQLTSQLLLEELLVQENDLVTLPPALFTTLPCLKFLNAANNRLETIPPAVWTAPKLQELNLSLNLLTELPPLQHSLPMDSSLVMTSSMFYDTPSLPYMPEDEYSESQGQNSDTPSPSSPDFVMVDFASQRKKLLGQDEKGQSAAGSSLLTHHALWRKTPGGIPIVEANDLAAGNDPSNPDAGDIPSSSPLLSLNLAHNSFAKVPKVLACLAPALTRLNLSYNNLKVMGHIGEYPSPLRQLDLSHNQIQRWFYAPTNSSSSFTNKISSCYCPTGSGSLDGGDTSSPCNHKRHIRLDQLKTLLLAGNTLKTFELSGPATKDDVLPVPPPPPLWFPSITMIDLSENVLREVTPRIAELSSLSVLNLSGNVGIEELPPEMGLLNRMWNLQVGGCGLGEPLKSMVESKRVKTLDVIGYLKSVLEDAKPYSRIKLMVVGVQGIGKTSLLHQLRQEGGGGSGNSSGAGGGGGSKDIHDHWARRMGAASKMGQQKSGKPMSTVGVDIGSWVWGARGQWGPVTFRTWDFGGQREYYATHVYFLSRRSLYLVVWNICDGEKGLNEIVQWLVNIQARAPNSPVILVGTHFDLVSEKFPPGYLDHLQQKIRDKFICISDPEKRGLPKVLYSVEISCKTRHNIRHLASLIYDTVWGLKTSTGRRLLEQRIPSKYIHLEEIVAYLAGERKAASLDPVLPEEEFKSQATHWLAKGFDLKFRDDAEIHQACTFLHENGVLLHYEDATLRDLYFLDPQWLCDVLAHVVTVREVNPFAPHGLMRTDDLLFLFKGKGHSNLPQYVMSLLSKFELAVPFDPSRLLIPALLPPQQPVHSSSSLMGTEVKVRVPLRSRGWALKARRHLSHDSLKTLNSAESPSNEHPPTPGHGSVEGTVRGGPGPLPPLQRFLLLSYFPSGFWPRLISRILSDDRVVEIVRNYFVPPPPADITEEVVKVLDSRVEWSCWQTGMELRYGSLLLLRLREDMQVGPQGPLTFMLRRDDGALCESSEVGSDSAVGGQRPGDDLLLRQQKSQEESAEQVWETVDLSESSLLEILVPSTTLRVCTNSEDDSSTRIVTLSPAVASLGKLVALAVDHVDTLLEDWYPSIGTRFVHTSEGKYLVTRLLPCPHCAAPHHQQNDLWPHSHDLPDLTCPAPPPNRPVLSSSALQEVRGRERSPRMSTDSGVGHSPSGTLDSSDIPGGILLKTGIGGAVTAGGGGAGLNFFLRRGEYQRTSSSPLYSWSVEFCILHAQKSFEFPKEESLRSEGNSVASVRCPKHGEVPLKDIAPDVLFLDLGERGTLLEAKDIQRGTLLGRGAFGFVFGGKLSTSGASGLGMSMSLMGRSMMASSIGLGGMEEVAIKMFQPIDPGGDDSDPAVVAYRLARSKWARSPAQSACRAYMAARSEVRLLAVLSHPHVVPFLGVVQSPLALLMPRAPRGALDSILNDYRRSGAKVTEVTARITLLQIGKALEYLHSHRIIYRDLKSENVLVWAFPPPFYVDVDNHSLHQVDLKLADYGISRSSWGGVGGVKGFGGTEGFMAPEIIRYNGEEEYTEAVDLFSYAMLAYELLALRPPFAAADNPKEHILEGHRPPLTPRDLVLYPTYLLDLMVACWAPTPRNRPTASQVVAIASSPEFLIIRDVVSLGPVSNVVSALALHYGGEREVWASCSTGGIYCVKASATSIESALCFDFISGVVTAMCEIKSQAEGSDISLGGASSKGIVWMGDTLGKVTLFRVADYSRVGGDDGEGDFEGVVGYVGAVVAIRSLAPLPLVAIAFSSGRLFLCNEKSPAPLTELGKSPVIHCLVSRESEEEGVVELWTGERAGMMNVYRVKGTGEGGVVVGVEEVGHYETVVLEGVEVLLMDAPTSSPHSLFSYVYPGSVIYGWDGPSRTMTARLDVGKLLPVRESIEEELNSKPLQVTVLRAGEGAVYIGTNWGFIFLAEPRRLRPLTFFRSFEQDVRSFNLFPGRENLGHRSASPSSTGGRGESPTPSLTASEPDSEAGDKRAGLVVVTLGKGFSNLIEKSMGLEEDDDNNATTSKMRKKAFAQLWTLNESTFDPL